MAYKISPENYVASNVYGYSQILFYRDQVRNAGSIGSANRTRFIQYRLLFRPQIDFNHINLLVFDSSLIKLIVGY